MEILIDGFSEEWESLPIGRTYRSAYEIDGITYIETLEPVKTGWRIYQSKNKRCC